MLIDAEHQYYYTTFTEKKNIMEAKVKKLVAYLKRTKKVSIGTCYKSKADYWEYYYAISGWLEGKYFCIYLLKAEHCDSEKIIGHTTDCKEEMQKLFNKYFSDETRE